MLLIKNCLALILFLVPATALSATFQEECDANLPKSSINIRMIPYNLKTDFSKSVKELTRYRNQSDSSFANKDLNSLGMLSSSLASNVKSSVQEMKKVKRDNKTGRADIVARCSRVNYEVTLGIEEPTLYVAREFTPGTCSYRAIYAHEMEHSNIHVRMLQGLDYKIKQRIESEVGVGVLYNVTMSQLDYKMKMVLEIADQELEKINRASASIDTPEEYKRVLNSCGSEIESIIRKIT